MSAGGKSYTTVRLAITVEVDPASNELLDLFDRSCGSFSISDVVRSEIESNLESVPYVRHVSITCIKEVRK
jgi:hypothetical protein